MKAPIVLGAAVTLLTAPLAMAQMRSADVAAGQGRTGEVAAPAVPDAARAADIHSRGGLLAFQEQVGKGGLEPPRAEALRIVSPMRLPVPPLPQGIGSRV